MMRRLPKHLFTSGMLATALLSSLSCSSGGGSAGKPLGKLAAPLGGQAREEADGDAGGGSVPGSDEVRSLQVSPSDESGAFATALADLAALVAASASSVDESDVRYLSLAHLQAGEADDIKMVREGASKLFNSLSWLPALTRLGEVDEKGLVLRVRLSRYGWTEQQWELLAKTHPEPSIDSADLEALRRAVGSSKPLLRADWFISEASMPPLYYDLLGMPNNLPDLEKKLGVDLQADVDAGRVVRAGFDNSLISTNHRVAERHESRFGYLWRSYEFGAPAGNQNIFTAPLGPVATRGRRGQPNRRDDDNDSGNGTRRTENAFATAGGEFFFQLPNHMMAYYIATVDGKRLDEIPPEKGKPLIPVGVSCMGCHGQGPINKEDLVRERFPASAAGAEASAAVLDEVLRLYVPQQDFAAIVVKDRTSHAAALKKLGIDAAAREPVMGTRRLYFGK